jgi:hypothetical protein
MMKSAIAGRHGNERRKGFRVCLYTLALGLYLCVLLAAGCATSQPGQTAAEVNRQHRRVYRLNTQMLMSDIDKFLLLEQPSLLTDRRIP